LGDYIPVVVLAVEVWESPPAISKVCGKGGRDGFIGSSTLSI
jgi:hypothetical protein